ncbi:MAG: DUF4340 domain-containing protein [Candidatus Omnitrophota bacterium]|nr:DUF4340 domain-containing protein [Candidatus Omnitrophota bacterium]
MTKKNVLTLGLILLVLVVGVAVKELRNPEELATEEFHSLELDFPIPSIHAVKIAKGSAEIAHLARDGEDWQIENLWGAKAAGDKVIRFLTAIQTAQGEMRADDEAVFSDFGIGEEHGFHIRLYENGGKEVLHLVLGTKQAGYPSVFLRQADSTAVYLARAEILSLMGVIGDPEFVEPGPHHWVDLGLLNFDPKDADRLEMGDFADGKEISGSRVSRNEEGQWRYEDTTRPFAIDGQEVDDFLLAATQWKALMVTDPAGPYAWDEPVWRMTFEWKDGRSEQILVVADTTDPSQFVLRSRSAPVVFQIAQYTLERMRIDDSKFFRKNPLGIDKDKIQRIVVHTPNKVVAFTPKDETMTKTYAARLESFKVSKLPSGDIAQKTMKTIGDFWTETEITDQPAVILDCGQALEGEPEEYPCRLRGQGALFLISTGTFEALYGNLDALLAPLSKTT